MTNETGQRRVLRRLRREMHARLDELAEAVMARPEVPERVEMYRWIVACTQAPEVVLPVPEDLPMVAEPTHEPRGPEVEHVRPKIRCRHAGFAFRVGWGDESRTAVLWADRWQGGAYG